MFHFPASPPTALYIQTAATCHNARQVPPFGHPRITARLTTPRGLSRPPTSFIGAWCQGIHRMPHSLGHHRNKMLAHTIHKSKHPPHTQPPPDHTQPEASQDGTTETNHPTPRPTTGPQREETVASSDTQQRAPAPPTGSTGESSFIPHTEYHTPHPKQQPPSHHPHGYEAGSTYEPVDQTTTGRSTTPRPTQPTTSSLERR
jgi:hypothetical protein